MLNIFSLLPLCKGWSYKINVWTRKIARGETLEVERVEDLGVLHTLTLSTNDCFGGFNFTGQAADLSSFTVADAYPQSVYAAGGWVQDPAGWVQLYYRPNPQSSAGLYFYPVITQGFQGATMPYVPTTVVRLFLLKDSTQQEATVSVTCLRIIITDRKQFIRSLRAVIGMPTIQDIDPALLAVGTEDITQKGEFDKKEKEKQ